MSMNKKQTQAFLRQVARSSSRRRTSSGVREYSVSIKTTRVARRRSAAFRKAQYWRKRRQRERRGDAKLRRVIVDARGRPTSFVGRRAPIRPTPTARDYRRRPELGITSIHKGGVTEPTTEVEDRRPVLALAGPQRARRRRRFQQITRRVRRLRRARPSSQHAITTTIDCRPKNVGGLHRVGAAVGKKYDGLLHRSNRARRRFSVPSCASRPSASAPRSAEGRGRGRPWLEVRAASDRSASA